MQRSKGTKVNIKRGWGRYFLVGCVATLLVIMLLGLLCGFLIFRIFDDESDFLDRIPEAFCTEGDEIYQAFVANRDEWIDTLSSSDREDDTIIFSTSEGHRYGVFYEWRFPRLVEGGLLAVIVNSARDRNVQAYIYSPNEPLRALGGEVKYMGQDIYCFNYARYYSLPDND